VLTSVLDIFCSVIGFFGAKKISKTTKKSTDNTVANINLCLELKFSSTLNLSILKIQL
jgi:hypothetical protein